MARPLGLTHEEVVIANGASELISAITSRFVNHLAVPVPTFDEFVNRCRALGPPQNTPHYEVTPQDYLDAAEQIREGTVETFHTPDGVEYVSGTDGAFKYLESVDESVRVEGPHHIPDDLMQTYLDRTHQANAFVADFFDFVPAIGIRFTISPEGTHYIMGRLSGARSDFYPFDIDSHILHDDHDSIVHEFTHVWNQKYLPPSPPTGEFRAQYLGNASVFVRTGGDIEDYSLKNCNIKCQGGFYDSEGNLLYNW